MTTMIETIAAAFADTDAAFTARQTEWALGRNEAVKAMIASTEYKSLSRDGRIMAEVNCWGGKGWMAALRGRSVPQITEFCAKNCEKTFAKRNAKIAKALDKAGATEVISGEMVRTEDGLDGDYKFQTADGVKRVNIRTIIAGGYNVQ